MNDDVHDNELMQTQNNANNDQNETVRSARASKFNNNDSNCIDTNKKTVNPPPITFKYTTIVQVRKILSEVPGINMNSTVIRITEHGIKVQLADEQQYDILIDLCKQNTKILFFTHTKKQERKIKFCLYGLWKMPAVLHDAQTVKSGATANCFSVTKCCCCTGIHESSKCPHLKEGESKIPENFVKCASCGGKHTQVTLVVHLNRTTSLFSNECVIIRV